MFSNKTYAIRGIDKDNTTGLQGDSDKSKTGIQCRSNVNLIGSSINDTIIKVIPNSHERYSVFRLTGVKNIKICNMTLKGDTLEHTGTTGEWGTGITCTMSQNIILEKINILDMWGDGIYIGLSNNTGVVYENIPKNVLIKDILIDNVGRNGVSLCSVDTLYIENLKCKNINRTFPKSGIDIECEGWVDGFEGTLKNVRINNYYVENCARGIDIFTKKNNVDYDIEVNNYTTNNCAQGILCEDYNSNIGNIKFNNCYFKNSRYNSISCVNKSATYRLTLDNVNILNNGIITATTAPSSICNRTAILVGCSKEMVCDIGNLKINNLRIYNDNDILCRRPIYISTVDSDGITHSNNGYKFKDICINNILEYEAFDEGAGGIPYTYIKHGLYENLDIDSRKFIYTGTYSNPTLSTTIDGLRIMSDINLGDKRMVFYMKEVDINVYDGFEYTFKKENPNSSEFVISTASASIIGIDNPNDYKYLYTKQNGSELKIKLINGQWYVVDIKGIWSYRGGL